MPSSLDDKMHGWLQRGQQAIESAHLQPTLAGYWPTDCLLAQESKGSCFCLSFPPPDKKAIPELCTYLAMQLHYHNAQAYVYLSTMTIQRDGKPSQALGIFGATQGLKQFWITPYQRAPKGEIEFSSTFSVDPMQVGAFGDLFVTDTKLRPGMHEMVRGLYDHLQKADSEKLASSELVESYFTSKQLSNPFPGVLPEEALSLCTTFLKSRQSTPLSNPSILVVGGG